MPDDGEGGEALDLPVATQQRVSHFIVRASHHQYANEIGKCCVFTWNKAWREPANSSPRSGRARWWVGEKENEWIESFSCVVCLITTTFESINFRSQSHTSSRPLLGYFLTSSHAFPHPRRRAFEQTKAYRSFFFGELLQIQIKLFYS